MLKIDGSSRLQNEDLLSVVGSPMHKRSKSKPLTPCAPDWKIKAKDDVWYYKKQYKLDLPQEMQKWRNKIDAQNEALTRSISELNEKIRNTITPRKAKKIKFEPL